MGIEDVLIDTMPIQPWIGWLIRPAHRYSQEAQSPESWPTRRRYLETHPTEIVQFKSMNERINSGTRFLRTILQR
jgi:hypothetical protein